MCKIGVDNVSVKRERYIEGSESYLSDKIEAPAASSLRKLKEEGLSVLTEYDRFNIAKFAVVLEYRV